MAKNKLFFIIDSILINCYNFVLNKRTLTIKNYNNEKSFASGHCDLIFWAN